MDESDILSSSTASYGFLELMSRLGEYVKLEDVKTNPGIKNFFEKAKRFWKN